VALRAILAFELKTFERWRVHGIACTSLDTGCRIEELLTARVIDFEFDNLLLLVTGKGRKQRKVLFSIELGKLLFRFGQVKEKAGIRSRVNVPGEGRREVGASECKAELLLPAQAAGATAEWVPPSAPHLCDSIPPQWWRCRAALDHPRTQ
jgi:site-specific recombinase XerC